MLTGYIEGYYGSLLDWNQRLKIVESLSALNLNSYFYCPKEDPFHRLEWAEDYSDEYLLNLGSFFESAKSLIIELIFRQYLIIRSKLFLIWVSEAYAFYSTTFHLKPQNKKGRSMQKF